MDTQGAMLAPGEDAVAEAGGNKVSERMSPLSWCRSSGLFCCLSSSWPAFEIILSGALKPEGGNTDAPKDVAPALPLYAWCR